MMNIPTNFTLVCADLNQQDQLGLYESKWT